MAVAKNWKSDQPISLIDTWRSEFEKYLPLCQSERFNSVRSISDS